MELGHGSGTYVNGTYDTTYYIYGTNSNNNDSIPEYTYQDCGIYSVTLIVTDDNGCKDTITKQVEVHCEPTEPITVILTITDTNDCQHPTVFTNNFNYTPDCVGNPTVLVYRTGILIKQYQEPFRVGIGNLLT